MMFGANTDVGKTLASAGLVGSALRSDDRLVHYIKPLQCGGSDESFVRRHIPSSGDDKLKMDTVFQWETPTSPHLACQLESKYVSPSQIIHQLQHTLDTSTATDSTDSRLVLIETAGGVLSPSSSPPPSNDDRDDEKMWIPQASLYQKFIRRQQQQHSYNGVQTILVGDTNLGGISCTLSALESLWFRNYTVSAIIFIGSDENYYCENASTLEDYLDNTLVAHTPTVFSLPSIPPDPSTPLDSWYQTTESHFDQIHQRLLQFSNHYNNKSQ